MPNRDGTGPEGKGARTGRSTGNCSNTKESGSNRPREGRLGRGKGMSRDRK